VRVETFRRIERPRRFAEIVKRFADRTLISSAFETTR
jgi:hypothetical protein